MNSVDLLRRTIEFSNSVCSAYLSDLTDEELMMRPVEGANHIAWQLGHLIVSEHNLINIVCPGSMPDLPDGFENQYESEHSASDSPSDFHSKDQFFAAFAEQRNATLSALDQLSPDELMAPAPNNIHDLCQTVAEVFALQGQHWLMHGGQWAILRRKLGKPPLF